MSTSPPRRPSRASKGFYPIHQLAESLYFMEHPPTPVLPGNLAQFDAQIPDWLRSTLDALPPDDARRRLTILYRQIYPPGKEIPPPPKEEPSKAKGAVAPKAPTAQPGTAGPVLIATLDPGRTRGFDARP